MYVVCPITASHSNLPIFVSMQLSLHFCSFFCFPVELSCVKHIKNTHALMTSMICVLFELSLLMSLAAADPLVGTGVCTLL